MTPSTRSKDIARLERFAVIQSLSAGTVPAVGLRLLQVGRSDELRAVEDDLRRAEEGVSNVRFISGPPESGKTFFLNLVRSVALERGFVVARTEFSAARRLHSATGEARALYRDLMTHLATRAAPDGLSMGTLVQDWGDKLEREAAAGGKNDARDRIAQAVRPLYELSSGFDFATVLIRYHEGCIARNDQLRENALRWLRAEYSGKAEAAADLGVRSIIDDDSFRDALTLFAAFVRLAGHSGLVVLADDLTSLTRRIKDTAARRENYDVIVELLSDCLEGRCRWLVMLFGIEDSCVDDRQRGLYSNPVLATWLAPNRFASNGHRDLSAPVIRLQGLNVGEYPVLLRNVRDVFANGVGARDLLPDEGIGEYVRGCVERMGGGYFDNPREVVKDFIDLLHLLAQHPSADWRELLAEARPPHLAASTALPGYPEEAERGAWPGWYAEQIAIERGARFRRRLTAAVVLPLLALGLGWGAWELFKPQPVPFTSSLIVKYSDVRGGLRQPLDEFGVPLSTNHMCSIEANPNEPCFLYLFILDSTGRIVYSHGKEAGEPQRGRLQLPEGETAMWPVLDPTGTRTFLLLGSKSPVADLSELKSRVSNLRPIPQLSTISYVELRDGKVVEKRNPNLRNDPSAAFESDVGFLDELSGEFGAEFPIIQAVAFHVLSAKPVFSPSLDSLKDK